MKLNKLLPIVALSGIATIAMPLVSCGKGAVTINLDTFSQDGVLSGDGEMLRTKNSVNVTKDTKYNVSIDFSNFEGTFPSVDTKHPLIGIGTRNIDPSYPYGVMTDLLQIHASNFIIDGVELQDGGDIILPGDTPVFEPNHYYSFEGPVQIQEGFDLTFRFIVFNFQIKTNSKLSATITSSKDASDKYFFTGFFA